MVGQAILAVERLTMLDHLLRCGLANIDNGQFPRRWASRILLDSRGRGRGLIQFRSSSTSLASGVAGSRRASRRSRAWTRICR